LLLQPPLLLRELLDRLLLLDDDRLLLLDSLDPAELVTELGGGFREDVLDDTLLELDDEGLLLPQRP